MKELSENRRNCKPYVTEKTVLRSPVQYCSIIYAGVLISLTVVDILNRRRSNVIGAGLVLNRG